MKLVVAFLLVLAVSSTRVFVTLNVFSGTEDPTWVVSGEAAKELVAILPTKSITQRPVPWYRMGYSGFEVTVEGQSTVAVYNNAAVERALLASGISANSLEEFGAVVGHVKDEIHRLISYTPTEKDFRSLNGTDNCNPPVRGSDTYTKYDPKTDVNGCFITRQGENNCYNYGNDVLTNSFAQPGRGSGQKWSYNTCDDIRASAIRDKLVWAGTTLPTKQPSVGHYVALLIWPQTNFHWIRFDSDPAGFWSHKPGGTAVRNVDNNNQKITDPSRSDFSPWTQFCGYMTSIPSNVTIN
jgi:hypothetical protein